MCSLVSARNVLERLRVNDDSSHAYRALALGKPEGSYVALNQQGHPALFVPAENHALGLSQRANVVSLKLGINCSLYASEQGSVSGRFHVLQCESSDADTVDTFVLLLDALLERLRSEQVTADYLTTFFRILARLFSVKSAPDPAKERQGLWGELLLIRLMGGALAWTPFWHTDPYKRFDFSVGPKRLEVKTTIGDTRTHSFSHRQLFTTGNEEVAIASFLLRQNYEGLGLRDLIAESRNALAGDPTQLAKLEASVRSARMNNLEEAGPCFDEPDANDNLAWFWAQKAPKFTQPEPPGVSEARYKVDLTTTAQIPGPDLISWLSSWRPDAPSPTTGGWG